MEHIFKEGESNAPTFLLLHGTGGDENDLLPLSQLLNPNFNVLSVRGEVSENGMNRFFKRFDEGQYDIEDLELRTNRLTSFLHEAAERYGFDLSQVIPVGFSNGANIAISMILHQDILFETALLYAPLYPIDITNDKDLSGMKVLLSMGENDPIVTTKDSERVIEIFESRGANVTQVWVNSHELTQAGVTAGQDLLNNRI
ncbi:methylhydroquinone degradation carboxylesterase MhqD [Staphylococcus edaphicus]|uniref:Alpha/beta hydrolase n=1 Tax=Staphylococcus edaphicus TaxID=1955013 RepID=A0A2C6WPH1_9STAP|nr:alpha/beta hydrolase [Staphylococcus edaphicus]PHK49646.1 carboxylesterase [Staphylococcus edaphicus]UQW81932.1 alpha/beta hydrolase [Staphylococcus edaphicus]